MFAPVLSSHRCRPPAAAGLALVALASLAGPPGVAHAQLVRPPVGGGVQGTVAAKDDGTTVVRFEASKGPTDPGIVWLFRTKTVKDFRTGFSQGQQRLAWRGEYVLLPNPKDPDEDIVTVGFFKRYETPTGYSADLKWSLNARYLPQGGEFRLRLPAAGSSAAGPTLTLERAYFVDDNRAETVRYYPPSTLLEKIAGHGPVRQLRNADFLTTGTVLRLEPPRYRPVYFASPPPGFKE